MVRFISVNRELLRKIAILLLISLFGFAIGFKIVHIPAQMEMVLLLTLLLFYPIIKKPSSGLYLLFLTCPFLPFFRRLYYLRYERPTVDPLIALGDIIILLMMVGHFFLFKENRASNNTKYYSRVIIGYFAYLFLRTFFLNILPLSDAFMRFRFYGPAVLLFFLGMFYAHDFRLLKRLWWLTVLIGCIAALYGFKQLFFGFSTAEQIWFSSISFTTLFIKGIARPFSLFQSPATFADYMQLATIGVIILISFNKNGPKHFITLLLPFFFYAALITSVRSNWIGILLSLLLWIFLLQLNSTRRRIIMLVAITSLFIITQVIELYTNIGFNLNTPFSSLGTGLNPQYLDRLVFERTTALTNPFKEHSLLSRISLWKYLLLLAQKPLMGLMGRGVGTLNADSLYFTYLAEFGYPGVLFIISFIFITIKKGFSLIDHAPTDAHLSLAKGITLMNIVFAVINLTGTHIHSFPGDAYFWFWNGVLLKLEASVHETPISDNQL